MTREDNDFAATLAGMSQTLCLAYTPIGLTAPCLERFHRFEDMAARAEHLRRRGILQALGSRSFGRDGSRIPMAKLLAAGAKICEAAHDCRRGRFFKSKADGYERRNGPVAGTACRRGGGGCHRSVATLNEMKSSQPTGESGEPAPRAARSLSNIPDAWDDIMRGFSHCWKQHGKGRKSWQRKGRESFANRKAPWIDPDLDSDCDDSAQ